MTQPPAPFKGLSPYEEQDSAYFFGRANEIRIIAANLIASRLTLLYGPSGVGKSSVLRAGVMPYLKQRSEHDRAELGLPKFVAFAFPEVRRDDDAAAIQSWTWHDDPGQAVAQLARRAVSGALQSAPVPDADFPEALLACQRRFGGKLLLILDQFEEFFLYHGERAGALSFLRRLAALITDPDARVQVLLSIREDALGKLDVFKPLIPRLYDNYLRLTHLPRAAGEEAIRGPIEEYNRGVPAAQQVGIEDAVVTAVLDHVGAAPPTPTGDGKAEPRGATVSAGGAIETAYLQMVMTRLWRAEVTERRAAGRTVGPPQLRLTTLQSALGGPRAIVDNHVEAEMAKLTRRERDVAEQIFDRLVTPSESKITQSIGDLAHYLGRRGDDKVLLPLLNRLSGEIRILRSLGKPIVGAAAGGDPAPAAADDHRRERYEIFHDMLARPILTWCRKHRERRRLRRWLAGALAGGILIAGLAYRSYTLWVETRPWGVLTNLTTGHAFPLTGDLVSVGRNAEDYYQNQVKLTPRQISRIHVLISRGARLIDMRSLNGTTVNAEFIRYGDSVDLPGRSFIVLAGLAPFSFARLHYTPLQLWKPKLADISPAKGWGLFIDGARQTVQSLDRSDYFLSFDASGALALSSRDEGKTRLYIHLDANGYLSLRDERDEHDLFADLKIDDYTYVRCTLPPGEELSGIDVYRHACMKLFDSDVVHVKVEPRALTAAAFEMNQQRFQIVPVIRGLEPDDR